MIYGIFFEVFENLPIYKIIRMKMGFSFSKICSSEPDISCFHVSVGFDGREEDGKSFERMKHMMRGGMARWPFLVKRILDHL